MSNIYVWIDSDNGKEITRTANKRLDVKINVGSASLSKTIANIRVIKTVDGFSLYVDDKKIKDINSD